MRSIRFYWFSFLFVLVGKPSFAYEPETHRQLSKTATEQSVLAVQSNNILSDFGLSTDISEFSQQEFLNSEGEKKSISLLIMDGAEFEDNFSFPLPRPIHHFYDPDNDEALQHPAVSAFTNKSPDWALEDTGDISSQNSSYKDALDAFYNALTLPTKTEREQQWGKTFETLGNVIHHIQDMAQPEHTRNDLHCDALVPCGFPGAFLGLYDKSFFESRSKRVFRSGIPGTLINYPAVSFPTVRDFWTTRASDPVITDRRGIADFTNRNFVSKDTNFEIKNGAVSASRLYGLPVPVVNPANTYTLTQLLSGDGTSICQQLHLVGPADLDQNAPCEIEFIESVVTDSYSPSTVPNLRAASLSLFDQYLGKYNVNGLLVEDGDSFHEMDVDRLTTINRFNIDSAHTFLIPRAVAYGAGLIDHFFRGKIDMAPNPNGAGWIIKNLSDEDMEGTFTLYYDYIDQTDGMEKRAPVPGAVWVTNEPIASGDQMVVGAYTVPGGVLSKTLVFSGRLGAESNVYAAKYFGGWSGPTQETSQYVSSFPVSATDDNGNAIVVYRTLNATAPVYSLWSQRYTHGVGWASPVLLSSNDGVSSHGHLAMDADGDATVIYDTYDEATLTYRLWSQRFTPQSGWAGAVLLATSGTRFNSKQLAGGVNGNAIVVYGAYDLQTSNYNLWSRRYAPGNGWDSAVLLSNNLDTRYISLAMDDNDDAVVIYGSIDAGTSVYSLLSRRYTSGGGWTSAVLLSSNNMDFGYSSLAMGANGDATVVYLTIDRTSLASSLWSQHYTPGGGWASAILLATGNDASYLSSYQVSMDSNSNAILIYLIYDTATLTSSLWSQRYTPGSGWAGAVSLSPGNINNASLAMDAVGNAAVVYTVDDAAPSILRSIVGKHYQPGIGWNNEILLSDGSADLIHHSITMSENGRATVTWRQNDGADNYQLWSNHYTP